MRATSTARAVPQRRRPRDRKAQIALAAAELFCARGYHGVGIDEIAAVVGISGPAVYRHFPTKYAILVFATRELSAGLNAAAAEALAAGGAPAERMDGLLGALARFSVRRRRVSALYQWKARYLEPEHRREFREQLAVLVAWIGDLVVEVRPELSRPVAEVVSQAVLSAVGSIATHRASITDARAEQVLRAAAWALVRSELPTELQVGLQERGEVRGRGQTEAAGGDSGPEAGGPGGGQHGGEAGGEGAVGTVGAAGVRPGSRREALLTEAIRLFDRFGYHAVGIDDIARAAGLNPSGVYRYFPGKADLLAAVYYRAAERLTASTNVALAEATSPLDALRRLTRAYVDLTFEQSDLVSVYLAENNNLPTRDRHELRRLQRLHVEEWVRLLQDVRPELAASEARLLVHAALNLVTDLGRLTFFDRTNGSDHRVCFLALRLLVP